jgi:HSP20 family molecular chaperone IbpA
MSLLFPRFQDFSPLFRLAEELDQTTQSGNLSRSFAPRFDVKETKEAYELHGELPGVEQSNINIEWADNNSLTISGHTEHRSERSSPVEVSDDHEEKSGEKPNDKPQSTEIAKTNDNKGVAKQENTGTTRFWVSERSVGTFHRTFQLPGHVDHEKVQASLKNGILSVVVPKTKPRQPRKIAISS